MQTAASFCKSSALWVATVLLLSLAAIAVVNYFDDQNTLPIAVFAVKEGEPVRRAANSTKPEIVLLGQRVETRGSSTYLVADMIFVNPLDVTVSYTGYRMDSWSTRPHKGEISPLYRMRVKDEADGEMRNQGSFWCGTGAGEMIVRPHEAGRFHARIPIPFNTADIGFSCTWSIEGVPATTEIWSPMIVGTQN